MSEFDFLNLFEIAEQKLPKRTREYKGKSVLAFPDSFTIIDIETTGLSPEYDSILELAAIKVKSGDAVSSFQSLVNYDEPTEVPDFITELTGITQDMIDDAPQIGEVFPEFLDFIAGDILVGHNVNFDINFIYDEAEKTSEKHFVNDFVDTMRWSRRLHPEEQHNRLKDLAKRYNLDYSKSHRALKDCELTFDVFQILEDEAIQKYGSVAAAVEACKPIKYNLRAKDITATTDAFDEFHPLYKKHCVITGKLERFTRKEAMQIIANVGGINDDSVSKKTNFLILGNNDYCPTIKGGKSTKQKAAEKLKANGSDIEIVPETTFYEIMSADY